MTDPILAVENLTVRYGSSSRATTAVKGVSFEVARGEVFGLVGESGSGKSSVCTALMRLLPRTAQLRGSVRFDGRNLVDLNEKAMRKVRGRRIALVPQQPMTSLSPTSTIGKQMGWYLGELLEDPEIHETLTSIGLRPVLDRAGNLPQGFSGGQLQRLLIAIASLAHEAGADARRRAHHDARRDGAGAGAARCCSTCAPSSGSRSCTCRTTSR